MKVRVLKSFGGYKRGQEFDWSDGMVRILIARGIVEPVREETVEQATAEDVSERAVLTPRKRQK